MCVCVLSGCTEGKKKKAWFGERKVNDIYVCVCGSNDRTREKKRLHENCARMETERDVSNVGAGVTTYSQTQINV